MANQPNLRVRLSADLDDIKKGMAMLRGDFAKLKKDAAGATPSTAGWRQGLADVRTQLAGVVSLYAVMRGARWYLDQADQAANLAARLRLATKSQDEFTKAQQATYAIAQRTSAEWGSVVGLYAQLAQTTGMGQERILALTETISQAFQVSGASAEETSNGLRQLQQAMAGGVLRAEEFNTIIETSPRIVQALADHFGIAFGDVRKYVNDGKVSSEQFAQALLKGSADIQRDFDKLPLTVSRATQQVRNALLGLVGDADSASGASNDLATGIQDLARTLESPEVKQGFATFVGGVVTATKKLAELLSTTVNVTKFIAEELAARLHGPNADDLVRLSDAIKRDEERLQNMRRPGSGSGLDNVVNTEGYARHFAELEQRLAANRASYEAALAAASRPVVAPDSKTETETETETETDPVKVLARSNALMRDTVSRALAELERLYKGNEVSLEEYFATRQRLAEQAIDLEIEQARNELAVTKDLGARRKLEEQIIILQRDRAEVATTAAREQKAAEEGLAKSLAEVELRLKELRGESVGAERAKLEAEFQELKSQLRKNGHDAGVATVDALIDGLVAKAQGEELKRAASAIASALQGREAAVSAQVAGGMLGFGEGERQIAEARARASDELRALRDAAEASLASITAGTPGHAAVLAGIDAINTEIATITASQQVWNQRIEDLGASAFGGFLSDLATGAASFKDAFNDMVRSFVAGVAQMMAQEIALRSIRSLMGSWGGSGVGSVVREAIPIGSFHTGGIAGRAVRHINVNPLVFGNAPRYHNGGIAGLKPDEVPAILQTGERVLSRKQTAAFDAAGGGMLRVEILNRGQPSQVESAGIEKGQNGESILKMVLAAVADDMASGGQVAQAGASRFNWDPRL